MSSIEVGDSIEVMLINDPSERRPVKFAGFFSRGKKQFARINWPLSGEFEVDRETGELRERPRAIPSWKVTPEDLPKLQGSNG